MAASQLHTLDGDPACRGWSYTYLGPARVVQAGGAVLTVQLPSGERVPARLALAYGYCPCVDDQLVVIGDAHGYFVVGLLESQGELNLEFAGDVKLHARDGELQLVGDEGVEVRGSAVRLSADRLSVFARSVVQRTGRLVQQVRGLMSLQSGEKREVVHGELTTRAERASLLGRDEVSILGKEIHLG